MGGNVLMEGNVLRVLLPHGRKNLGGKKNAKFSRG
jgi:hypothetical protein